VDSAAALTRIIDVVAKKSSSNQYGMQIVKGRRVKYSTWNKAIGYKECNKSKGSEKITM
jgi:hypothetical protein